MIAISLFIILLSPILLIHAHGVSAQYPDNAPLSVGKATYSLCETVCITLAAAPEEIVFFNIISPTGIIYNALPSKNREYQFKPDIPGSYVVNVLLRAGDDETLLTTGFVVADPEIVFGAPEQGKAVVGEPVNWSQHISVTNHEKFSISNFSVSIPLPLEHFNLSSGAGSAIIDSSIPVDLAAGEGASFNISYQTSPVRLAVTEEMIGISDLIPPDAFGIGVYREIGTDEGGPRLTDEITVKQVTVWHNSSMHYHNIPVAIESRGFDEIVEFVDDAGIVAEMTTERSNETLSWTVPELSDRTYTVVGVTREQGDARIGEPLEWQLNVSGTIVRYKTPAPFTRESNPVIADGTWKKEVVVGSNASVHYSNVTAYSKLGETEKSNLRLFWLANGSRIDVTDSEEFDVSFSDTNGSGIIDMATWNVPMLSNQSFEVGADITVINVQSYPTVGGNWGVEFRTVGCANLTITAVNGTTWSRADEEGDLQFLEIKCGDQILNYTWINDSVFIEDYSCNLTGHEVSKVLTPAAHTLQFRFGSDVEYAHNWATDLSGWDYRQLINISNTAGDLSYYQVKIELNSSNDGTNWNWTDNGNDTRVTYYNSTAGTETEIPFWIESWNSTAQTSIMWVNVTSLADNTNTTIYLYYGNTSASSASNGTNTFEFFDDFETWNQSEWIKQYIPSTLDTRSDPANSGRGDVLYFNGVSWRSFKRNTYIFTNGTIHFEHYRPTAAQDDEIQFLWRVGTGDTDWGNMYEYAIKEETINNEFLKFQSFVGGTEYNDQKRVAVEAPNTNVWHDAKIVVIGNFSEYWLNGEYIFNYTDDSLTSGYLGGRNDRGQYFNNVFVCKYASPEPAVSSIGNEEIPSAASLDITISTPQNNSCTNDNTTTFSGTTNIAANITYSVDGGTNETACNSCTSFSNTTQALTDGSHNITVYGATYDNATDTDSETVYFTVDTTAPASITGLANQSSGSTWINWTWTNPTDANFDHTEVWLNETFYANVTQPAHFYNATGLNVSSWYEIRTRTVDDCQNINTTWVNDTAKTQEVGWWDSSWSYRRVITLQGGASELTDFPYYIHLSDTTHIQDDGDDLRFLDGLTELKYEIERFETSDADIWLKIPVLPANGKNIFLYYGNSDASSGENKTGVWDSNYKGVWHMPDSNTTTPIIDEVRSIDSVSSLQGVTTDGTYLYTSAGDNLYKYWLNNGTSVSSHATTEDSYSHNGDIKYKNGIIYMAVCNFNAQNPRQYSVSEYNATDFSFIREHKDLAEYWTAGLDYHDGYWWVLADTGDPNWVHRYNSTESGGFDNSSYTSYALGNTNSQGITWVGDEIFEANHGNKMGRFHWNGTGFEHVFTYTAGTNFPSGTDFQGSDYYNNQLYIARRSANNIAICNINDSSVTNTISDSTSNSNTGTKRGDNEPDEVAGKIGYAQDFDGSDDDIGTAESASLKMYDLSWTIESWLYANSSASYTSEHILVEYGTSWTPGCYQLTTTNDHTLKANFNGVSSGAAVYDVDWTDSQWHHAAAVLDTGLNKMYVYYDGNEGTNVNETSAPGSLSDMPLWFACRGGTLYHSDVILDEVRVSDIARSADWLNMSYEVVGNQSGKVAIGTEESQGGGEGTYIPPDPTTIANTAGNFWVNHTWGAGNGNVTNSYNVSVNGVWHNGTTAAYNHTYTPHAWQNITVYAYNTSGTGTRSSGNISQDTQIPNNPVTITNTSSWSGDAGANVYVDYDATDADSDTPTFSCNRTGLFTDFNTSTGQGNWTAVAGTYYVDFGVSDGYGSTDNYTMTITVGTPTVAYIPPDPKNIQSMSGNFWVNHVWGAGTGNVTDSYNVSVNGAWHNGTTAAYNDTYTPHAWQNITVYAYNTSGTGTRSSGNISQDTQIPNNPVTITNTSGWSGDAGANVYVDYDATDADSDTPTFSCNRTDLFTDFSASTGQGNWTAIAGTYYVDFGVSDGYGSTDNYTMTITVGTPSPEYIPPDPTTIANTTGNFWVNYTWNAGGGNVTDSFNVSMNATWTNDSALTYMNVSVGSSGWANITVWAWNASGTGTLSAGSVSDEVQAPEALLTCTCGDICVNENGWWRNNGSLNVSGTQVQHAIDNATAGDSIYVYNGSYTENIDVARRLTLTGEGTDGVNVTNSTADSHVFNVSADYVNISGFNVTGATGNMKAGIYIGNGVGHCNISGNTISDNYIGIYLNSSSSDNLFADNTISDNVWDNYLASSTPASSNNTLNGTKIDFTYCGDVSLKGVGSPASDPTGQNNIGKFINVTNQSAGAWVFLNFTYSDADVNGLDESSLAVWKYNGTAWVEDGWNGSRYLDTANNVVGVNITSFSVFAPMASPSPVYPGWDYRQLMNISNTAGDLSYYPVRIDLNSSNAGTNWSWTEDENATRFTYYNYSTETETEIPFWIESWNSTAQTSTIWVNVTYLAENTNTTIYLYYGNTSASSASNGTNTFEFFDDFPGSSIDTTKWTSRAGTPVVTGGTVQLNDDDAIRSPIDFGIPCSIRARSKATADDSVFLETHDSYTDENEGLQIGTSDAGTHGPTIVRTQSAEGGTGNRNFTFTDTGVAWANYNIYEITRASTDYALYYQNQILLQNESADYTFEDAGWVGFHVWDSSSKSTLTADWIFVRKYVLPEPVVSIDIPAQPPSCPCGGICVNPTGWWHDGGNFNSSANPLLAAYNNATSGDTICVTDGTYHTSLWIGKDNFTFRSENGTANCIVNATGDYAFATENDYVNISGFTVENATKSAGWSAGIIIQGSYCNISYNLAHDNFFGINIDGGDHNLITHNNASYNSQDGIHPCNSANNNEITSNTANNNTNGIYLYTGCDNSEIINNTAKNNSQKGIGLELNCNYNNLTNNTVNYNGDHSIFIYNSCSYNNLTLNDASNNTENGIHLGLNSQHNTLTNNTANNNENGIDLIDSCSYNNLSGNVVKFSSMRGIILQNSCDYNNLGTNIVSNNTHDGIHLENMCGYNNLTTNTANSNERDGIDLENSDNNTLTGNIAINNTFDGIILCNSTNNTIATSTVSDNHQHGIQLIRSNNTNVSSNSIKNNLDHGCYLNGTGNSIHCNNISGNGNSDSDYGIYLDSSSNNTIYNNYFNNTYNACDNGNNTWNTTPATGTNIINGSWLGGNYWSDYAGADTTDDGLGDTLTPYNSSDKISNGGDYHPLVHGVSLLNCTCGDICVNTSGWWSDGGVLNANATTPIQAAIDNVAAGETIYVWNGTYSENVNVNERITLAGEGAGVVNVTNSTADSHVFNVSADYVNISGFNVTGATGNMKAGIYVGNGVDQCNVSGNTVSDNCIGIYLNSSSSDSLFANNTISDNIWDLYIQSSTSSFTNNTLNGTTVSLTYNGNVSLKGVGSPASDPTGQNNIGKFINATNQSVGAWVFLNFTYSDADVSGLDESSLAVWKYNGTAWVEDGWNGSRYLDTANNVVGVNITSFSVFAPMGSSGNPPVVTLNRPENGSFISNNWAILNATVTDADNDNMTVYFYANNDSKGLNASEGLVYIGENVADGSTITYNLTALPVKPDEDGLAMLLHFDNISEYGEHAQRNVANAVYDFTGNGNNGTLGGATAGTAPVWNVTGGKFAGAFEFDGTSDFISTPVSSSLNMGGSSYTIEIWVQVDASVTYSTERLLVEYGGSFGSGCYQLTSMNDTNFKTNFYGRSSDQGSECNVDWTDGMWHHLVGVFDNDADYLYTYYDGVLCDATVENNASGDSNNALYIASRGGTTFFSNCTMDEVAIYNKSLSADEILDHYRLGEGKYYWQVNASDGVLDTESDVRNFTIDQTAPDIQLNYPDDKANPDYSTVYFNWTATDNCYTNLTCNLTIDGVVNISDIPVQRGTPKNQSVSGFSDGSHNWSVTCWDNLSNERTSSIRTFGVKDSTPNKPTLTNPANGWVTPDHWSYLNATVTDPDADLMTVYFYANENNNGLNDSDGLVHIAENVANDSEANFNLTALPVKPSEESLAMLMHFDNRAAFGENSTQVYDFSGNGNNGTVNGATIDLTGGKFAGAFEFDGTNYYIDCGNNNSLNIDGSSFTVSLWFNTRNTNNGQTLLSKGNTDAIGNCLQLDLFRAADEDINLRFWGDDLEVNTTITADTWHHAAFTYNTSDNNQTLYLDGAYVGNRTATNDLSGTNGDTIRIGKRACACDDNLFNGTIDEVALYTRTLSATEVLNQYRLEKGKYYWKVSASDGVLSNESEIWNFYAGYKPDLRVIDVTFDHWDTNENRSSISETGTGCHVKENRNITINATIANYADGNVTSNFDVSFFDSAGVYGNWSRCFRNSTYNVSIEGELGNVTTGYPYNTTYMTGYWNSSLVGTHNISVWADPANSARESAANTTNNNASAVINVSAWQKYYGTVSGSIALADSAASSLYNWTWSNETDAGYAYIVNDGASVNWNTLHALGCDSDDTLNASGHDFLDADTNLGMVVGSNNATGFADNNITELWGGGDPSSATDTASFTVYGTSIPNVPVVNSTVMTNHTSVGSANFITGILWDATSDTNGYYDTTNETLVFVTKIRVAAAGIGGDAHNYEFATPCTLNPVVGGDLDIYMELK
jgi:parallel beta-helix repeat protein